MPTNNPQTILSGLNERQREAVETLAGPVLVIAGPGSGKTRALTHRIAYLIARGVSPGEILAVTFTNKAAGEMRERVRSLLGKTTRPEPLIGTFHSFAAFLLRTEASRIGWKPNFTIYDEDDAASLLKEILKEERLDPKRFPTAMVAAVISNLKNDLIYWDEYEGRGATESFPRTMAAVYERYQSRLKFANAFDFDDLLLFAVRLLQSDPLLRRHWQDRFRYIHVDEYQDTNLAQYELVRLLAGEHRSLFVIGDDAQSIYSWRRADYRNILNFERDWPEAKVVLLEENYRSTPQILEAANRVIQKNREQKQKNLWTRNAPADPPHVVAHEHERGEAEFIASEVLSLQLEKNLAWRDIAVLYRTNAQSRVIEEAMIANGIPYIIIGGIRFFLRREVKDIVAYLRYLENPEDAVALKRIVNVPARGIGPKTFLTYLSKDTAGLALREREKVEHFESLVARLREGMRGKTLSEFLRFLIQTVGYEAYLTDVSRESDSRIENVRELVSLATRYDTLPIREAATKLIEEIALASDQDEVRNDDDRVRLMTIHAAKGLEFPAVFLVGLEEGILPHAKSIQAGRAELEEERRLVYVGMTRAKAHLYFSWALTRTIFGERQVNMPSRFLRELPPGLVGEHAGDPDELLIIGDGA